MATRKATEEVRIMLDSDTYRTLREHSALRKEPVAAVVRRFIARGLLTVSSDVQSQVLADAVRAVIVDALRPTRHYAYLAAREAAASHRYNIALLTVLLQQVLKLPSETIDRTLEQADSLTMRYAAQHLKDREPDDPAMDAPAEPLPGADDEVTVEDGDTASMIKGA